MNLKESYDYVLAEARANIEFVRLSANNVQQAQQVNSSLANIVAMERNIVMDKAVERAIKNDAIIDMPRLSEHRPRPARAARIPQPVSQVLGEDPAGELASESGPEVAGQSGDVQEARGQAEAGCG